MNWLHNETTQMFLTQVRNNREEMKELIAAGSYEFPEQAIQRCQVLGGLLMATENVDNFIEFVGATGDVNDE